MVDVVILNGGSSSGKTSIAKCLQDSLSVPWLRFGIDDLIVAMPDAMINTDKGIRFDSDGSVSPGSEFRTLESAWMRGIAAMVRGGARVIVEDVFVSGADARKRWQASLGGLRVLWVGVFCDPAVASEREVQRGDRVAGMAASQATAVHVGMNYDVRVDTTVMQPEECARIIVQVVNRSEPDETLETVEATQATHTRQTTDTTQTLENGAKLTIRRLGPGELSEYCKVPSLVDVRSILQVKTVDGGFGGFAMEEVPVPTPHVKDYDSFGETPADWPKLTDVSPWCILLATVDGRPAGGACVAARSPNIRMLEGRDDMAVLWDIRVAPEYKRMGIGQALFARAVQWSHEQGMKLLKIETQNTNVHACRFYASQGAQLGAINRFGYKLAAWSHPEVRDEVMLLWYYAL